MIDLNYFLPPELVSSASICVQERCGLLNTESSEFNKHRRHPSYRLLLSFSLDGCACPAAPFGEAVKQVWSSWCARTVTPYQKPGRWCRLGSRNLPVIRTARVSIPAPFLHVPRSLMRFTLAGVQPEISCHHRQVNGKFHQVPCTSFITSPSVLKSAIFSNTRLVRLVWSYQRTLGCFSALSCFRFPHCP